MAGLRRGGFRMVRVLLVLVLLGMVPEAAVACERCFGVASDSLTAQGISMAMLGLLGMMVVVWAGVGAFFFNTWRRARQRDPGRFAVSEHGHLLSFDDSSSS